MSASIADRVDTRTVPEEVSREVTAATAEVTAAETQANRQDAVLARPVTAPPAFNTIPEPPGPIEKALLLTGWFLVERFVAVVLFFKKGEFH